MSDKLDDTIAAIPAFVPGQVGQDLVVQARAWARSKGEAAKTSLELGGHLHGKN
jgi:hypothetical protein